jgi:hypothetical protein
MLVRATRTGYLLGSEKRAGCRRFSRETAAFQQSPDPLLQGFQILEGVAKVRRGAHGPEPVQVRSNSTAIAPPSGGTRARQGEFEEDKLGGKSEAKDRRSI